MIKTAVRASLAAALLAPLPTLANGVDGAKPAICALGEILECSPTQACERVSAQEIGAPRFLRVDFAAGEIARIHAGADDVISAIERSEVVDGRIILQGAEDGREEERDGLGWSLSIDQESGDMVLTGSGNEVAFVIFGACTVP